MTNIYANTSESSRAKTKEKQGRWRRKKVLASLLSVGQVEAAITTDSLTDADNRRGVPATSALLFPGKSN